MSKFRIIFRPLISISRRGIFLWQARRITNHQRAVPKFDCIASVAFLSWFLTAYPDASNSEPNSHFDVEQQISNLILKAEECILNDKRTEAKKLLNDALKMADDNQAYGSLSYLCDLLSSLVLSEGELVEAENILVKFIEKLLQLGYQESNNIIVKFKLKLARLYQLLGSQEMAEYGYRDCISVQEKKMENAHLDEESNSIYLTALFWYGKLFADQGEFGRARNYFRKCLDRIAKSRDVLPAQKMVVLHNIAAVSAMLKDFDGALNYLFDAIEICLQDNPNNPDLPLYVVQVGLIYLHKGIYEAASFWCQTGVSLASHEQNELAETEGLKCVQELRKLQFLK